MNLDRMVLAFSGTAVLLTLLLSRMHSPHWLWLTAFVGANLLQASITGFCPMVGIVKRLGLKPGPAFQ